MRFHSLSQKQNGVVLFIALIALVAMMAAAVALTNSLDTGTQISTNRFLAQSAQSSADVGFAAMKMKILDEIGNNALGSNEAATILQTQKDCYHPYAFVSSNWTVEPDKDDPVTAGPAYWGERTRGSRPMMRVTNPDGSESTYNAFVTRDGLPEIITWKVPPSDYVCKITNEALGETIYYMADLQCPDGRVGSGGFTLNCLYPNNVAAPVGVEMTGNIGLVLSTGGVRKYGDPPPDSTKRGIGFRGYGVKKDNGVAIPTFAVPLIRITVRVDGMRNTRTYRQQVISLFHNPAKP